MSEAQLEELRRKLDEEVAAKRQVETKAEADAREFEASIAQCRGECATSMSECDRLRASLEQQPGAPPLRRNWAVVFIVVLAIGMGVVLRLYRVVLIPHQQSSNRLVCQLQRAPCPPLCQIRRVSWQTTQHGQLPSQSQSWRPSSPLI